MVWCSDGYFWKYLDLLFTASSTKILIKLVAKCYPIVSFATHFTVFEAHNLQIQVILVQDFFLDDEFFASEIKKQFNFYLNKNTPSRSSKLFEEWKRTRYCLDLYYVVSDFVQKYGNMNCECLFFESCNRSFQFYCFYLQTILIENVF